MEELIRYLIPGSVAFLPLYIFLRLISLAPLNSDIEMLALTTVLSPTLGFVIQTFHMYIHEISYNHSSQHRPMINHIIHKFKEKCQIDITPLQAFVAWDYTYYDKFQEGTRLHQRRAWDFAHASKAVSYSFYFGACICFINILLYFPKINWYIIDTKRGFMLLMFCLYLISGCFFNRKYLNILTILLNPSEILSAEKYWPHIENRIQKIIENKIA